MQFCRHDQRQVGIILSNKDNNIMTKKYFNYQGAPWQIIETTNPWGKSMTYAVEMDSTDGAMLNTEEYDSDWEYVEAKDVRIDEWFLKSDPNDLFDPEDEEDTNPHSSKLKTMLENLKNPFSNVQNTLGQAADILGMIRDRHETVEMPPTAVINPKRFSNSKDLETAINELRERHGAEATILVGTTPPIPAETLLATMRNKETIGISSYPDKTKPLGVTLDPETLDLLKRLRPKK